MSIVYLTRIYRFNAGHRLYHPQRDDAWNWETYGKCSYPEGHGHNYVLELTVSGPPDPSTGQCVVPEVLDSVVELEVMERLDHRNLNTALELRYGPAPTTEVLLLELWDRLAPHFNPPTRLARLRISETAKNIFEYSGEG